MATWYETEPGIFEEEKTILEGLGFVLDGESLAKNRIVKFVGPARADPARILTIEFPSGYPSTPPTIRDDGALKLLPRHHTAESRAFCLFGHGGQNWSSKYCVRDALDEVDILLKKYPPGGKIDLKDEAPEPVSDLLPVEATGGILIPPEITEYLEGMPSALAFGKCQILFSEEPGRVRGVIVNSVWGQKKVECAPAFRTYLPVRKTWPNNTLVVRLPHTPPLYNSKEGPVEWVKHVPLELRSGARPRDEWLLFVYPEETGVATQTALAYTAVHLDNKGWKTYRCFPLTPSRAFSRIPGLEPLKEKHVVVLGVGALGSRIAASLAASGVSKFTLVDPDIYEPANAVRHLCGINFFGIPKVFAVAQQISLLNPGCVADIMLMHARAGTMVPDFEDKLVERIESADLIIDASASEQVGHWIDHLSFRLHKTCIHAKVTNGAWGGDAFRVVPGSTPCWACHEDAHAPPPSRPAGKERFPPGCSQPTFTGNMAEVSILAELAATLSIETLLGDPHRDFKGSHIRWFARSPEGHWKPHIEVVIPKPRTNCFCTSWPKQSGTSS